MIVRLFIMCRVYSPIYNIKCSIQKVWWIQSVRSHRHQSHHLLLMTSDQTMSPTPPTESHAINFQERHRAVLTSPNHVTLTLKVDCVPSTTERPLPGNACTREWNSAGKIGTCRWADWRETSSSNRCGRPLAEDWCQPNSWGRLMRQQWYNMSRRRSRWTMWIERLTFCRLRSVLRCSSSVLLLLLLLYHAVAGCYLYIYIKGERGTFLDPGFRSCHYFPCFPPRRLRVFSGFPPTNPAPSSVSPYY